MPRVIFVALEAFNCMSFIALQSSKFFRKFIISELKDFSCKTSDNVELLSTYLHTGHPAVKSSINIKNECIDESGLSLGNGTTFSTFLGWGKVTFMKTGIKYGSQRFTHDESKIFLASTLEAHQVRRLVDIDTK